MVAFLPASSESLFNVPQVTHLKNVMFFSAVQRKENKIIDKGGNYLFSIENITDEHLVYFINSNELNEIIGRWADNRTVPISQYIEDITLYKLILNAESIQQLNWNSDLGLLIRIVYAEMGGYRDYNIKEKKWLPINEIDIRIVLESIYNRMADVTRRDRYQSYTIRQTIMKPRAYQGVDNSAKFDNTINHYWEESRRLNSKDKQLFLNSFYNIIKYSFRYFHNTIEDFLNTEHTFYVTDNSSDYFDKKAGYVTIEISGKSAVSACAKESQ